MRVRQQSSTSHPVTFLMVDDADHVTGKTGLTPAVTLSKDGGAFGAAAGAVTEIGNGWYALAGNATDRGTAGDLLIHASAAGADPVDERYLIVPWDPFDGAGLGLTDFDAVTLAGTQGAVTFGQVKILANVSGEGALHVVNSNASGRGQYNFGGDTGLYNYGIGQGQFNYGLYGQYNYGSDAGLRNQATSKGQHNVGSTPVSGVDAAGTRAALGMAAANLDARFDAIPQDVADAMKLAPSAGAAAAGSVDAKLDAIQDKTDLLSGGTQVIVVSALAGSALTITRGDTLSASFVNVGSVSGYANIWFTVKRDRETADSAALVQIDTDTGLLYANGVAASAASGSITVDDAPTGDLTIALAATVTATLPVGTGYYYDIQWMAAGGAIHTLASGVASVAADVTRSVA